MRTRNSRALYAAVAVSVASIAFSLLRNDASAFCTRSRTKSAPRTRPVSPEESSSL